MKKLLSILIMAFVATTSVTAMAADKKPAAKTEAKKSETKKVKKHKKAESSGKVADDKPKKVAPAKKN
jgi:Ni/Co efflux regulator RcnB